ncbi:hypothetical protein QVD17_32655 [Tagetes erecta]|uniref:Uncharacterized protein n=1 Tax=Tagetes erecta TaxID=13708 RepID=A0AAD8K038_TARER|nr:hypothetical protein QVD17_32655 [Tagetes erecta]
MCSLDVHIKHICLMCKWQMNVEKLLKILRVLSRQWEGWLVKVNESQNCFLLKLVFEEEIITSAWIDFDFSYFKPVMLRSGFFPQFISVQF